MKKKNNIRGLTLVARKLIYLSGNKFATGVSLYDQALPKAMTVIGVQEVSCSAKVFLKTNFQMLKEYCTQHSQEVTAIKTHRKKAIQTTPVDDRIPNVKGDSFLSSYSWRKLRMQVLLEQGRKCACCGATPYTGAVMNVDHIKPRRLFPELALDKTNLQVLCHVCNHGKGNWDQTDWRNELNCDSIPAL